MARSHALPRRRGRRGWAILCLGLVLSLAVGVRAVTASDAAVPDQKPPVPAVATQPVPLDHRAHQIEPIAASPASRRWDEVLDGLGRIRALAWRRGDPRLLGRVYDGTASALRRDRARLRQYADRGLTVRGARLVFGPVRLLRRTQGMVRLRVTDQLRPAIAVRRNGQRFPLPYDRPTRHTLVLHRDAGRWRIAEVRVR